MKLRSDELLEDTGLPGLRSVLVTLHIPVPVPVEKYFFFFLRRVGGLPINSSV